MLTGEFDLLRPLTGPHRAVVFDVLASLYERQYGMNADFSLVPDKATVFDIIASAIHDSPGPQTKGAELDPFDTDPDDPVVYTKYVYDRLVKFGLLGRRNDTRNHVVIWILTPAGKKVARFCAESKRKGSTARQRSIRSCENALKRFLEEKDHVHLVDAYEYARSIFDDVCQVSDLFAEYREDILKRTYECSSDVLERYFEISAEFERRGMRYLTYDNINAHAAGILASLSDIRNMHPGEADRIDAALAADSPSLFEMAGGEPLHRWIVDSIENVVDATRTLKHPELVESIQSFLQRYVAMIHFIRRRRSRSGDDPLRDVMESWNTLTEAGRDMASVAFLRGVVPFRMLLHDPEQMFVDAKAERTRTPRNLVVPEQSREDKVRAMVMELEGEAFTITPEEIRRVLDEALSRKGTARLSELPTGSFKEVLAALMAPDATFAGLMDGIVVTQQNRMLDNGVFSTQEQIFRKVTT